MSADTLSRRGFIAAALTSTFFAGTRTSLAGSWPNREVKTIVPFAAGGGTDLVTRIFAEKLSQRFGKTFYVENLAGGAGGSVGSLELARSAPDGYTIGTGTSSGMVVAAINPNGYNPLRDLTPIARYGQTTIVLAVNSKLPIHSFDEFIAHAKANPWMTYASSGIGSANHLAGEMLARHAELEMTHVPYKGEGAAMADVLSGQVDAIFVSLATGRSHIESGALRAFAVTSAERFPLFPDLPTMLELGFDDLIVEAWYAMYVPHSTPQEVQESLVAAVNEIRQDPVVAARLIDQFTFNSAGSDTPEAFRAYMATELERFRKAAKLAGLVQG